MSQSTPAHAPPMQPSAVTTQEGLRLAREKGEAARKAFVYFAGEEGEEGREQPAGDYLIGCIVKPAEGFYYRRDSRLEWRAPEAGENAHIDVSVRDGADGRFVPGLTVLATVIDGEGPEIGTQRHPFVWHHGSIITAGTGGCRATAGMRSGSALRRLISRAATGSMAGATPMRSRSSLPA
jgi:hypothetical protein